MSTTDLYRDALRLLDSGTPFCLGMVTACAGSTPQGPGAKGLFLPDGRVLGTIGGGCLEMECRRIGLQSIRTGEPRFEEFRLNEDFGWDDGLICGGKVQALLHPRLARYRNAIASAVECIEARAKGALVFDVGTEHFGEIAWRDVTSVADENSLEVAVATRAVEARREWLEVESDRTLFADPVVPPYRLLVCGAGHVGAAVARLAASLDFHVTVVDDRREFANRDRIPEANELVVGNQAEAVQEFGVDRDTFVVIVTRGHRNDAKVLRECVQSDAAYIGMIGSRRKAALIRQELLTNGLATEEQVDRVRSPIGLDIGAESVNEIALAITGELVQKRTELRSPVQARIRSRSSL